MADKWLLIETFGGPGHEEPSVIAVGRTPKRMQPLTTIFRLGTYLDEIRALIARVVLTGEPVDRELTSDGRRQIIVLPLKSFAGKVNGVFLWRGDPDEEPPPRDPAGAWYFNLTTHKIGGSDDLLDLYRVPPQNRRQQREFAEAFAFGPLIAPPDEPDALAVLVEAQEGARHQATWGVRCDDGAVRAANLAARVVAETSSGGRIEMVCCGITHDIGPAEQTPSAPRGGGLADRVVATEQQPGRYRAIMDRRKLALVKWVDDPMPRVAWQIGDQYPPEIHADDLPTAKRMAAELGVHGRAEGEVRVRSVTGEWMPVAVEAKIMPLNTRTKAALVWLSQPGGTAAASGGSR